MQSYLYEEFVTWGPRETKGVDKNKTRQERKRKRRKRNSWTSPRAQGANSKRALLVGVKPSSAARGPLTGHYFVVNFSTRAQPDPYTSFVGAHNQWFLVPQELHGTQKQFVWVAVYSKLRLQISKNASWKIYFSFPLEKGFFKIDYHHR